MDELNSSVQPQESLAVEQNVQLQPAEQITPQQKRQGVDRPHWITIVLGFLSPSVAIVALLLSSQSFKISQQALATSQASLKVGQRAYLQAKLYADQTAEGMWRFGIELRNTGNTPARVTNITATGSGWKPYNVPGETHAIGAKDSEKVSFALNSAPNGIAPGLSGSVPIPEVSVAYSYVDIFGDAHSNNLITCIFVVEIEKGHPKNIYQLRCTSVTNDSPK
jgi:hypothetical protein